MREPIYDKKVLKKRGLVTNGFCLPYNSKLTTRANEFRKTMTPMENKLWMGFLKKFPPNVCPKK
jgi:hypothetical protein